MTTMPDENPKTASVDDMAASIGHQLKKLKDEQKMLVEERAKVGDRLKWLASEIDKAERMTKALIPRHRRSKNTEAVV